jgi:MinD-like ATPase involved in chromosome partitioning or flagellar assembly
MKKGPYTIRVSSQKGGVGKTTIAVNLATALSLLEYKVLLVDGDYTNPSVGFHLGFDQVNEGFIDIATSNKNPKNILITHAPTGMHVIPGRIGATAKQPTTHRINELFRMLAREDYDFCIVDTSPGFSAAVDWLKNYDEAIIVTTPDMSSCTSAIRLAHNYNKLGLKHSMVINRIKNKGYEVSTQEIEESYEGVLSGELPEDEIVPLSISERIPAYIVNQRNKFSTSVGRLTKRYASRLGSAYTEGSGNLGIIARILAIFGIRKKNRIAESLRGE